MPSSPGKSALIERPPQYLSQRCRDAADVRHSPWCTTPLAARPLARWPAMPDRRYIPAIVDAINWRAKFSKAWLRLVMTCTRGLLWDKMLQPVIERFPEAPGPVATRGPTMKGIEGDRLSFHSTPTGVPAVRD